MVDAVILRAYYSFAKKPPEGKIKPWLIQLAREHLQAEVKRARSWRTRTEERTEADIPDTPPSEWVTTLGEERLDFYEPDEDLKLEDIIPDFHFQKPEDEAETRKTQRCLGAALAGLPRSWRRALLLRHVDGLTGLAEKLATGTWTHDYGITAEEAKALGLPVSTDVPEEVYDFMNLFPQPTRMRSSVEYVPAPYRARQPRP